MTNDLKEERTRDLQSHINYFRARLADAHQRLDDAQNAARHDLQMINELKREAYALGLEVR